MNLQSFDHSLGWVFRWTCETTLSATILIVLVILVQTIFGRFLPSRWRYALGLLVMLRLALPVAPSSSLSIFNLANRFAVPPPESRVAPASRGGARAEALLASRQKAPLPTRKNTTAPVPVPMPVLEAPPLAISEVAPASRGSYAASRHEAPPEAHPTVADALSLRSLAKYLWLTGSLVILASVTRRHRQFTAQLGRWETVREPRVLELLDGCKAMLGVKRHIPVLVAEGLNTPALFGVFQPRLLIPSEMLRELNDRELRHIFLHELVHLRRDDILINWAMIALRALHWFNPAVWLAFRRLRADQELACDAAVLARLADDEQLRYGSTLVKLLTDFSASAICPGAVPFLTRKQTIKRRIKLIATFKPAGRLALVTSVLLLSALVCATFTQAAVKPSDQAPSIRVDLDHGRPALVDEATGSRLTADNIALTLTEGGTPPVANPPAKVLSLNFQGDGTFRFGDDGKTIGREELGPALQAAVRNDSNILLRVEIAGTNKSLALPDWFFTATRRANIKAVNIVPARHAVSAVPVANPGDSLEKLMRQQLAELDAEIASLKQTITRNDGDSAQKLSPADQRIETAIAEAQRRVLEKQTLLGTLNTLSHDDLRQALPTIVPDAVLTQSLQDLNAAEANLAALYSTVGLNNPDVVTAKKRVVTVNNQIDQRVKGILSGLKIQVDADRAVVESLRKQLSNGAEKLKYDEFLLLKHKLDVKEQLRDAFQTRLQRIIEAERAVDIALYELGVAEIKMPEGSPLLETPRKRLADAQQELSAMLMDPEVVPSASSTVDNLRGLEAMKSETAKLDEQIRNAEANLNELRKEVALLPDDAVEITARTAPYYQAQADLQQLQKLRDVLQFRIEQITARLSASPTNR